MIFPSKRDWWLILILIAAIVIEVVVGATILWGGNQRWVGVVMIFTGGFIGWLITTNDYVVGETDLLLRCGPLWWTVPLQGIESITLTWNPLSSPALSLDRLWITYYIGSKKRAVMVSPLDKAGFLQAIVAKVPEWRVEGNRVIKA